MADVVVEAVCGRRIRELRTAQGWSQDELARRCQVLGLDWQLQTVARSETASRPMRMNEVAVLAAIFDVSPCDLFPQWDDEDEQRYRWLEIREALLLSDRRALQRQLHAINAEMTANTVRREGSGP